MKNISDNSFNELKAWLEDREFDIANGIDDLGDLRIIFIEIVSREPKA